MHRISILLALALLSFATNACKSGGSSSGSSGHGYGNLYLRYWWSGSSDGVKHVDWLIIYSEFPQHQSFTGSDGKLIVSFKDGTSHEIVPTPGSVTWLTPSTKPRLIKVDNLDEMVARIEASQDEMVDTEFDSPESLISELFK